MSKRKLVSMEVALTILDQDDTWRPYQVDYPEDEKGRYAIRKFEIEQRALGRIQTIEREGADRDPGWGHFTELIEREPSTDRTPYTIWMSDTRAEILEHSPILNKLDLAAPFGQARRVLINGLGLGMVAKAALSYPGVEDVDIVELDPDIISLVGKYVAEDPRVRIYNDDAYTIKWPPGTTWDLAWHDIWPTIDDDNLIGMDRLRRKYKGKVKWQGYWQKDGCLKMKKVYDQMKAGTLPVSTALEILGGKFHL